MRQPDCACGLGCPSGAAGKYCSMTIAWAGRLRLTTNRTATINPNNLGHKAQLMMTPPTDILISLLNSLDQSSSPPLRGPTVAAFPPIAESIDVHSVDCFCGYRPASRYRPQACRGRIPKRGA